MIKNSANRSTFLGLGLFLENNDDWWDNCKDDLPLILLAQAEIGSKSDIIKSYWLTSSRNKSIIKRNKLFPNKDFK